MSILKIDKTNATARLKCDGCGREFSVPFVSMGDKEIDAVFMRGLEAVSCDDCAERMRADERAREREERRRERLARIDELMEAAGIQPRFRRLSAEDAAPEVGEWILQGGNVMLSGESGSGKTTTVCRCLRRLIADGNWHHYAVSINGHHITILKDGKVIRNTDFELSKGFGNVQSFTLGDSRLEGILDEFKILGGAQDSNSLRLIYELERNDQIPWTEVDD